ncbi:thiamine pyrophosphate-dependent enzyme [Pseudonocardia sp. ICBG601]|uniref:thiamine pyrophosphate-dependent enzyme n=1 Tax=Pseudonocardia sp. ICBG601 TaxID=2846759 RepID=UPI0027E303D5|nr:thiamine pyrophosphate-dependent enzyme [Pseudonocardia sp. ICBG601]
MLPSYREHGVAWCARGRPDRAARHLPGGPTTAPGTPVATRFHPYTIVIGNQCLNAAGYAMGQRFESKVGGSVAGVGTADGVAGVGTPTVSGVGTADGDTGEATICYFGDGATSQGDVHEGFVWAAAYDAPLVFFCQNNQWAISVPAERQTRVPLYQRARGYGFPGVRVDGNDVLAASPSPAGRSTSAAPATARC